MIRPMRNIHVLLALGLASAAHAEDWFSRGHGRPPTDTEIFVCHGYTCRIVTPVRFGPARALMLARGFHALMIVLLVGVGGTSGRGLLYEAGVAIAAALIFIEHAIIRPDDLRRLNVAFFNLNSAVSLLLLLATAADLWLGGSLHV